MKCPDCGSEMKRKCETCGYVKPKAVKEKKVKVQKSEAELVREYADRVIKGKVSRGHTDNRFGYTKAEGTVNKELWLDTDFYFSVVFQSAEQKYAFLDALKVRTDVLERVTIMNGLKLAEKLGIKLTNETAQSFPVGELDLKPLVLDNEET